jgi:hypothetical protein
MRSTNVLASCIADRLPSDLRPSILQARRIVQSKIKLTADVIIVSAFLLGFQRVAVAMKMTHFQQPPPASGRMSVLLRVRVRSWTRQRKSKRSSAT